MLTRILLIPFIVAALVFFYLTLDVDEYYSIYIAIPVVIAALIWVMSPQINWWWYQRYPPKLDPTVSQLFGRHNLYYQHLSLKNKERFRVRVALFMIANDFSDQGGNKVPEDIKGMIAGSAVMLKFGFEDFLYKNFEKIIVYPKPFPSPQYPRSFHASEIYAEDGVTLFSAQQIAQAFFKPRQYFDLAMYEYAKVFIITQKESNFPKIEPDWVEKLENISGIGINTISQYINLPVQYLNHQAIGIHHFFYFPDNFKRVLPDLYGAYKGIFLQDPSQGSDPINL